jgi:hypothetical protein
VYSTSGHRRSFEQETRSFYRQHAYKLISLFSRTLSLSDRERVAMSSAKPY